MARNIKNTLAEAHDKFYYVSVTTPPALALAQIAAGLARLTEVMSWREDERRASADRSAIPQSAWDVRHLRPTPVECSRHWESVAIRDDTGRGFSWRDPASSASE
jgi:hypothetical protein